MTWTRQKAGPRQEWKKKLLECPSVSRSQEWLFRIVNDFTDRYLRKLANSPAAPTGAVRTVKGKHIGFKVLKINSAFGAGHFLGKEELLFFIFSV